MFDIIGDLDGVLGSLYIEGYFMARKFQVAPNRKHNFNTNLEIGMSPKNAAVVAHYSKKECELVQATVGFSLPDVAEQVGATTKVLLRTFAEKAGIVPGVDGAMRTISAMIVEKDAGPQTKDFIEVPDENVRVDCLKQLLKVHTDEIERTPFVNKGSRNIMISVSVRNTQPIVQEGVTIDASD
jgi:hypothetical protein